MKPLTVPQLMSAIVELAESKLNAQTNNHQVSLSIYDTKESWQAWLNWGVINKTPSHYIVLDKQERLENKNLLSCLKDLLTEVENSPLYLRKIQ